MSITVLEPVPLTTVQDAGRVGYAAQGYRSCGAAECRFARFLNLCGELFAGVVVRVRVGAQMCDGVGKRALHVR